MEENSTVAFNKSINATLDSNQTYFEDNDVNSDNASIWIIGVYFCILGIGACINLCVITSLLLQKRHGTTYLILQFSFIDALSIWVAVVEIFSLYTNDWTLNSTMCPIYLGTEVLVNVLTVYMHILLNFHAISAWNMQQNTEVSNKNPLTTEVDESNECLVWSENPVPNRTLNIDYRHKRTSVSIILPSMLIWFSCLSLCIPEYTLSTTVEYHTNQTLCTIVDLHYTQLLQYLLIIFRGIIPVPLLFLTFIIVLFKLFCNNTSLSNVKKNTSAKKFNELKKLLQLSIILSLLYIFTSFQRTVIHFLHIISQRFDKTTLDNFKMPPLNNIIMDHSMDMYLSMFHYSSIVLRPVICIIIIPSIVALFGKCFKRNTQAS